VTAVPSGIYRLEIRAASGVNLASVTFTGVEVAAGQRTTVNATLQAGGIVSGRVTDAAGNPVANADVWLWDSVSGAGSSTFRTNSQGDYTVTGLAPGTYWLNISPPVATVLSRFRTSGIVVVAGQTAVVNATLQAGGTVSGRVTDAAGNPVANADVWLWDPVSGGGSSTFRTNSQGDYTVTGLAPGTYWIEINPPVATALSRFRTSGIVVVAGQTAVVNATLQAGGTVSGRVTDGVGNPAANARVSVWDASGSSATVTVHTDIQGNYTATGLLPGRNILYVTPPPGSSLAHSTVSDVAVAAGQTTTVNVALQPGGTVSGRVTDAAGNPVANAGVWVWSVVTRHWGGSTRTDAQGNYTLAGLVPDTYTLTVDPPATTSFASFRTFGVVIALGQTTVVNATLQAGGTVSGRVTDAAGNPVANADVWLWDPVSGGGSSTFRTNSQGDYTVTGLAPGTYWIEINPPVATALSRFRTSGIVVVAGQTAVVNATLQLGGIVSGRVTDAAGNPVANAEAIVRSSTTGEWIASSRTDALGNYTVTAVPSGTHRLEIRAASGVNLASVTFTEIVVTAGQRTTVNATLQLGGIVSGRVTDAAGNPVANADVWVWNTATGQWGGSVRTNAQGYYTLAGVASGSYRLEVRSPAGVYLSGQVLAEVAVADGQVTTQNVSLDTGGRVSGQVTDSVGNPIANARVTLRARGNGGWAGSVFTDAQGSYTFLSLAQGAYELEAAPPAGVYLSRLHLPEVAVTPGQTTTQNVVLSRGGIVSGRVTDSAGNPVANAVFSLRDAATNAWLGSVPTDAQGNFSISSLPGTFTGEVRTAQGTQVQVAGIVVVAGQTTTTNVLLQP